MGGLHNGPPIPHTCPTGKGKFERNFHIAKDNGKTHLKQLPMSKCRSVAEYRVGDGSTYVSPSAVAIFRDRN